MVKLLVILACALGTAVAGRIPMLNDPGQSWLEVQRQGIRPHLMDLVSFRWQLNPWSRLRIMQAEDRRSLLNDLEKDRQPIRVNQEDDNKRIESELEERFTRVPISREILGGVEKTLPTSDVNSNRLLHVGRRRQQQQVSESESQPREEERRVREDDRQIDDMLETRRRGSLRDMNRVESESVRGDDLQTVRRDDDRLVHINRRRLDDMTPRRINRIGEGRRVGKVGPISEEQILQYIRKDNRLSDMSDEEIIEMLRRERQEKMERRRMDGQRDERLGEDVRGDDLQEIRRDDDRLVHINRRRLEQSQEQLMTPRPINLLEEVRREPENIMGRRLERENVVDRPVDSLKSVRRDDDRLVHINRRRLDQTREEMSPRRIGRIGEGRRVMSGDGDVDTMTEQDILQFIRRDNRLTNLSDEEIIEMLRRNRQRKEKTRQERIGMERDEDVQGEELQSLRRNDERLIHINRRRMDDDMKMEMMPRRIDRIGEGRRVGGDMDAMTDRDILRFIRWDNRLPDMSDDEILEMLRRQRLEKMEGRRMDDQREERVEGDDLQTVRRDDDRLIHINRRRLDQTL